MYMRLLGYPASSITILAAYNGQKHLISDVIEKRCGNNPLIGWPHKIATVDKYQGQQNDYILLSLTRTKTVGYLRYVKKSTEIRLYEVLLTTNARIFSFQGCPACSCRLVACSIGIVYLCQDVLVSKLLRTFTGILRSC